MAGGNILDIFNSDAFSLVSLSAAIDKLPYQPGRIGELGLFESDPVYVPTFQIEEREGKLALLPTYARGQMPQTTASGPRRRTRIFPIPHIPQNDSLLATDLEGKRAFGSENQLEVFSQMLNDKLQALKKNHEVTLEWHRIGALKGIVLDADGSTTVLNSFTEFGLSQTVKTLNFADTGTWDAAVPAVDVKVYCQDIERTMQTALGGTPFTGIQAICGNQFFDNFVHHATVRKSYEYYTTQQFSRTLQGAGRAPFEYGGIKWENYRGGVGSQPFMATADCQFFPTGVSGIFKEVPAPAPFMETVNTRGKTMYAKQERMKWDMGIEILTQTNVLYICLRPQCLIRGTGTNFTV